MNNNKEPLVGISCITYNHAPFLREMLEGIAKQQTDFPFIAVIGNDKSPDNTADILEEYRSRYPDIFKIINQPVNKGVIENSLIVLDNIPPVRYLTFCEGDDYWTDPLKLQKQVDWMECHPECAICYHIAAVKYENEHECRKDEQVPSKDVVKKLSTCDPKKLLLEINYIPTASVMYRRHYSASEFRKIYKTDIMPGDWFRHLAHARFGTIHFIPEIMSVYRKHSGGIFSSLEKKQHLFMQKYGIKGCRFYQEALKLFDEGSIEFRILQRRYCNHCLVLMTSIVSNDDTQLLKCFLESFPKESLEQMLLHKHNLGTLSALSRMMYLYSTPAESCWEKIGQYFIRFYLKLQHDGVCKCIKRLFSWKN